jgi:hypothetical protein
MKRQRLPIVIQREGVVEYPATTPFVTPTPTPTISHRYFYTTNINNYNYNNNSNTVNGVTVINTNNNNKHHQREGIGLSQSMSSPRSEIRREKRCRSTPQSPILPCHPSLPLPSLPSTTKGKCSPMVCRAVEAVMLADRVQLKVFIKCCLCLLAACCYTVAYSTS